MKPIMPSCRERLSADDFAFIISCLTENQRSQDALHNLLTEPETRDAVLDSESLFRSLVEQPRSVAVSPHLYFYVLTRRALPEFNRDLADYIAGVLVAFAEMHRLRALPGQTENVVDYVSDMLTALAGASTMEEFQLRVQVGNYTLFMTGIFPEHVRHRAERRGAPDLAFYEGLGSRSYRLAAEHRLAAQHNVRELFVAMSEAFGEVRAGLNRMSDHLLCLESPVS